MARSIRPQIELPIQATSPPFTAASRAASRTPCRRSLFCAMTHEASTTPNNSINRKGTTIANSTSEAPRSRDSTGPAPLCACSARFVLAWLRRIACSPLVRRRVGRVLHQSTDCCLGMSVILALHQGASHSDAGRIRFIGMKRNEVGAKTLHAV